MLRMNNDQTVPQLAFGMYKVIPEETEQVVLKAIEAGYRHFDTASFYQNEEGLGKAIKASGIPREDFFICSKVWNDAQKEGRHAVRKSLEQSLRFLQSDYLDLYLVHWPVPGHHVETYKEIELLAKEGKIKNIGISNYTPKVGQLLNLKKVLKYFTFFFVFVPMKHFFLLFILSYASKRNLKNYALQEYLSCL